VSRMHPRLGDLATRIRGNQADHGQDAAAPGAERGLAVGPHAAARPTPRAVQAAVSDALGARPGRRHPGPRPEAGRAPRGGGPGVALLASSPRPAAREPRGDVRPVERRLSAPHPPDQAPQLLGSAGAATGCARVVPTLSFPRHRRPSGGTSRSVGGLAGSPLGLPSSRRATSRARLMPEPLDPARWESGCGQVSVGGYRDQTMPRHPGSSSFLVKRCP